MLNHGGVDDRPTRRSSGRLQRPLIPAFGTHRFINSSLSRDPSSNYSFRDFGKPRFGSPAPATRFFIGHAGFQEKAGLRITGRRRTGQRNRVFHHTGMIAASVVAGRHFCWLPQTCHIVRMRWEICRLPPRRSTAIFQPREGAVVEQVTRRDGGGGTGDRRGICRRLLRSQCYAVDPQTPIAARTTRVC